MPTAARGATLILLGALLAQAPLTAAAYQPRDRTTSSAPATAIPASEPTTAVPSTETPTQPVAQDTAARSWSEVVKQVTETSPNSLELRSADSSARASSVMRCFKLEEENYCLGLGFVDQVPSGAALQEMMAPPPSVSADGEVGVEQDIPTGDLTPQAFVAERASMPKSARVNAELDEMQAAWDGRDKARSLRLLDASSEPTPPTPTAPPTATPTAPTTPVPSTPMPTRSAPSRGTPTPVPTPVAPVKLPTSSYIMKGFRTSQEKGYWCGPATFQSIDWADDNQKDTQASWAKDLGTTTSGTAISAMVKQTNLKTNWDLAAGTYIVQNVGHWNAQKFFTVHQNHLGDGRPAPVIEHTQLLKRYFPYLAFNHSGHYQVGRGYDRAKGTIAIYEVFNERRFNSRGNVTDGPKNIPATALFNATLANSFKNIGL
ncbi:peptidase C39-like protein [Kribbella steppae]|uniref:Peptidase C39-like protein n=1 Tax=Kribbella steppae TaxID=2512223 RepID=A0A4R2HN01_9ACTN|nr:C39 family peptidase [Kribbella steppae]TCO32583.1 peptidase C39-like protein [Kribbella steppae]